MTHTTKIAENLVAGDYIWIGTRWALILSVTTDFHGRIRAELSTGFQLYRPAERINVGN